jgi:hypothetical protein
MFISAFQISRCQFKAPPKLLLRPKPEETSTNSEKAPAAPVSGLVRSLSYVRLVSQQFHTILATLGLDMFGPKNEHDSQVMAII